MASERRLPLWATMREAAYFPWRYRQYVGVWVLVFGILSTLSGLVGETLLYWGKGDDKAISIGIILYAMSLWIPHSILFTIFAVLCHRMILVGEPARAFLWTLWWTKRETRFCVLVIGVYIVVALLLIPFLGLLLLVFWTALKGMGTVLNSNDLMSDELGKLFRKLAINASWGYFLGRFSLMFPAITVDLKPTLAWAWATSIGNGWRLALLVGALPFALTFVNNGLNFSGLEPFPWILSFVQYLLWYTFGAIEIAVLSIAFRELSGWHQSKSFEELQTYK